MPTGFRPATTSDWSATSPTRNSKRVSTGRTTTRWGGPNTGPRALPGPAWEMAAARGTAAAPTGPRRDDRVPPVDPPLAQSLEDRHGVAHLAPLAGIGRTAVDALVAGSLVVETGPSETVPKGDYETELRALIAAEHDRETVKTVFPDHTQSRVLDRG